MVAPNSVPVAVSVSPSVRWVRIFATGALADIRGYQLDPIVSGGTAGHLELLDVTIEPRADFVFAGRTDTYEAFNLTNGQMLFGVDGDGAHIRSLTVAARFILSHRMTRVGALAGSPYQPDPSLALGVTRASSFLSPVAGYAGPQLGMSGGVRSSWHKAIARNDRRHSLGMTGRESWRQSVYSRASRNDWRMICAASISRRAFFFLLVRPPSAR